MRWIKNKLLSLKFNKMTQISVLLISADITGSIVLISGLAKNQNYTVAPTLTPVMQEASDSSQVAGIATANSSNTPTPNSARNISRVTTPTPTPTLDTNKQQSSSNNQSDYSSSGNSNSQRLGSDTTQVPSPTSTQASSPTQKPTSIPTPDNTPFTASMGSSNDGNNITVTWTANKIIKFCSPQEWGGSNTSGRISSIVSTDLYPNSTTCSWNRPYDPNKKYYAGLKSTYDESITVGEKPPCDPNTNTGC